MMKHMILLCIFFSSNACAQPKLSVNNTSSENLYPYRYKSGKFGYVNDSLQTRIEPQYDHAELFTEHGFAVITDSLGKKGIINKSDQLVMPTDYEYIRLFMLNDFTLAEVNSYYYTQWRFWEWEFLPGFSLSGGGSDKRLFDTKVKRIKKAVFVLEEKPRKIIEEIITDKSYVDKYFDIKTLDSNQVLIDNRLFKIEPNKIRSIASGVKGSLSPDTFAQLKKKHLHIIDKHGKRLSEKPFLEVDSVVFNLENKRIALETSLSSNRSITSAYQNAEGKYFIYPNFSKALPQLIHENEYAEDPTAEQLIRGLWLLASVPNSDFFLFMSFRDGKRFIRLLDTQGHWHQTLPSEIPFTILRPSGDILWPSQSEYIPQSMIPEGWMIRRINQEQDASLYNISLVKNEEVRHGIWNNEKKDWLITPVYDQVYRMNNIKHWRFQLNNEGIWGIMDKEGNVLIDPIYYTLRPDGWVTKEENGEYVYFYLHPQTLAELREK